MKCGGIILCGGRSRRMGAPKETLPFGEEPMLVRTLRPLREAVEPVVVVGSKRQLLPELPAGVLVARDRHEDRGPLEGLSVGIEVLENRVQAAYVTGCDYPLLRPAFVRRMIELLDGGDAAVPTSDGRRHPLAAVYHVRLLPRIRSLLSAGERRLGVLLDQASTREVPADQLRDADPQLFSLLNVNEPAAYLAALTMAGLPAPAAGPDLARRPPGLPPAP